jgi:hypothetical protein
MAERARNDSRTSSTVESQLDGRNNTNATPRAKLKTVPASKRPAAGSQDAEQAAKQQAPTAVQPVEPEDAYLTGVSRSLQRRLLGLNVNGPAGQSKPHPEATAAGLHSTGSFTGTEGATPKEKAKKKEAR